MTTSPSLTHRAWRWWSAGTAVAASAAVLLAGGTGADLILAYWLEGLALSVAAYVKDVHSTGPATIDDATRIASRDGFTVPGSPAVQAGLPLPDEVRRREARRMLRTQLVLVVFAGVPAHASGYVLFGGFTSDPVLWLGLLASLGAGTAVDLWRWLGSEQPARTGPGDGDPAPILRMGLVWVIAMTAGLTATGAGPAAGTVLGVVVFTVARGVVEPGVLVGVERRRARLRQTTVAS